MLVMFSFLDSGQLYLPDEKQAACYRVIVSSVELQQVLAAFQHINEKRSLLEIHQHVTEHSCTLSAQQITARLGEPWTHRVYL